MPRLHHPRPDLIIDHPRILQKMHALVRRQETLQKHRGLWEVFLGIAQVIQEALETHGAI